MFKITYKNGVSVMCDQEHEMQAVLKVALSGGAKTTRKRKTSTPPASFTVSTTATPRKANRPKTYMRHADPAVVSRNHSIGINKYYEAVKAIATEMGCTFDVARAEYRRRKQMPA